MRRGRKGKERREEEGRGGEGGSKTDGTLGIYLSLTSVCDIFLMYTRL